MATALSTEQLALYNGALVVYLGESKLTATEDRAPRRVLDEIWTTAVNFCLHQGLWRFAIRTMEITADPAIDPGFGYPYGFAYPSDYIRTVEMARDENFTAPLLDVKPESAYWYANIDTIYVRYVSNDTAYGGDYDLWPTTFTEYVKAYLANRSCKAITGKAPDNDMKQELERLLSSARSKDAMNEPTKTFPEGSWVRALRGKTSSPIKLPSGGL